MKKKKTEKKCQNNDYFNKHPNTEGSNHLLACDSRRRGFGRVVRAGRLLSVARDERAHTVGWRVRGFFLGCLGFPFSTGALARKEGGLRLVTRAGCFERKMRPGLGVLRCDFLRVRWITGSHRAARVRREETQALPFHGESDRL